MFGEKLADLRKDCHLDQKELAKELGVSHHTISSYERGRSQPNHEMLVKIARYFDVSLDYLLGLRRDCVSYKKTKNILNLPQSLNEADIAKIESYIGFLLNEKK